MLKFDKAGWWVSQVFVIFFIIFFMFLIFLQFKILFSLLFRSLICLDIYFLHPTKQEYDTVFYKEKPTVLEQLTMCQGHLLASVWFFT